MVDTLKKCSETAFVNKLQIKLFDLQCSLQTLILLLKRQKGIKLK